MAASHPPVFHRHLINTAQHRGSNLYVPTAKHDTSAELIIMKFQVVTEPKPVHVPEAVPRRIQVIHLRVPPAIYAQAPT